MAAACGVRLDGAPGPDSGTTNPDAAGPGTDAMTDGLPGLGAWGTPMLVAGASDGVKIEDDGSVSANGLEMVFAIVDPAANNTKDIYSLSRTSTTAPWTNLTRLSFNTASSEETPRLADNDLTLYFASNRAGGPGSLDVYKVTRATVGGAWGTPALVGGVNTAASEKWYTPCGGSYLVIVTTATTTTGADIYQGTIGSAPTLSMELSSDQSEIGPFLSSDCKTVYFASSRSGTSKLYKSTRTAVGAAWTAPQEVTTFSALGGAQEDPWLSTDDRTFMFVSDVRGTKDIYISTR